jgi:hypothetical protein
MATNEPTSSEISQALDKLYTYAPNNGEIRKAEPAILSSLQEMGNSKSYDSSPLQDSGEGRGRNGEEGIPIEFYCWKDGAVGTIKILAATPFKAIE